MNLIQKFIKYKKYFNDLVILSLPIIMGNIGHMLIGIGDVFVAGKHGITTLSVIGIANAVTTCILIAGIGLLAAISPVLSNYEGEGKNSKENFVATIVYSQIVALGCCLVTLLCSLVIGKLGLAPDLAKYVKEYLIIVSFSTFGAALHFALKEFMQAYERVFFANFLSILAVFINIWLNFIFVFGWYGLPEMGPVGLAIATLLTRILMGLVLFFYCLNFTKPVFKINIEYYKTLLTVGTPIAIAGFFEFFAFNMIAIIMARVDGIYAACQSIMTNISGLTFMVPLAISNSLAVKVGFANGARNKSEIKVYSSMGLFMAVSFMTCCALCYFFFADEIIKIFSTSPIIIKICIPILITVGIFQIFDGIQVSCAGILKGMEHTKTVLIFTFLAHWFVGFPLGLTLAFKFHLNLLGFWIGITSALIFLAIALLICVCRYIKNYQNVTNF